MHRDSMEPAQHLKPSKIHYFFASGLPTQVWTKGISLIFAIIGAYVSYPASDITSFILMTVVWFVLGWFIAILSGWFILGPMYYDRGRQNGEPFHVGDWVYILVGPYRDRVVKVNKVWEVGAYAGGHRVQITFDENVAHTDENVFHSHQILRV